MTSADEEWRPIIGLDSGSYEISSAGRVRSLERYVRQGGKGGSSFLRLVPARILKAALTSKGRYPAVSLYGPHGKKNYWIHQMVCEAFNGPRLPGTECAHKDDIGTNNTPDNLYWATKGQNFADKIRNGNQRRGSQTRSSVLTEDQVIVIKASGGRKPERHLATEYNVSKTAIHRILAGETWVHVAGADYAPGSAAREGSGD